MWCGHCTRYCGWPDAVGRVEAPFVVDLCSLIQHCALESLKEALCMSVWPFSHGHKCIFIICLNFTLLFYTCSFAGSNSQKPVGELCV